MLAGERRWRGGGCSLHASSNDMFTHVTLRVAQLLKEIFEFYATCMLTPEFIKAWP
jgi:hypothetical protein